MHSATQQAALVRSGEVSARELVEASLAAIERLNPRAQRVRRALPERALAEADRDPARRPAAAVRRADRRSRTSWPRPRACRRRTAAPRSATGSPTTTRAHVRAAARGRRDRGRQDQHARARPAPGHRERALRRDPQPVGSAALSAGGSSGGSAAAVAAGLVPLADGSDFGGSIRIPAACCGVVGLKPSRGRVSIGPDYGDVGAGVGVDGALARTVADVAIALDAMAGYEPGDHHWLPPPARLRRAVRADPGGSPVRVALDAPARRARRRRAARGRRSAPRTCSPTSATTCARRRRTGTTRASPPPGRRSPTRRRCST